MQNPTAFPSVHVASLFISSQQLLRILDPGMRDETSPELTHLPTSLILIAQFRRAVPSCTTLVAFLMYLALAYRFPSWRDRDTPKKDLSAGSGMSKAL